MRLWLAVALLCLAFLCWMLAGLLFGPIQAEAMPQWIVYTVPDKGQNCTWTVVEGESSWVCTCVGTVTIRQIQKSYLWWQPVTGGGFAPRDSHFIAGKEGLQDSFPVPGAGNGYIVTRNPVGLSCPSPLVTVLPDVVTGIEPTPPARIQRWIDVHGRAHSTRPTASGIYLWQYNLKGTWSKARKHLILK